MAGRRLAAALFCLSSAAALSAKVTPVQKVIMMMQEMKKKGQVEMEAEVVQFAKFEQFCKDTQTEKANSISDAEDKIAQLSADIRKADSDAKVLGHEMNDLDASIAVAEEDKGVATQQRRQEHADYMTTHADYTESVDDLAVGLNRLKQMMATSPAAASSLIQELASKPHMASHAHRVLTAFLAQASQTDTEGIDVQAPEAKVFESQSGGVVDMMEQLQSKLEDEKATLEKEEMNAQHSYDMIAQSLTDSIENQSDQRNKKSSLRKQKEERSAEAKGELADAQAGKADDEKYLADLKATCNMQSEDFQSRQKLRGEELQALDKAVEIISSGAVSGSADNHLPAFVQIKKPSFAQLRSVSNSNTEKRAAQTAAASFLRVQGRRLSSHVLAQIAIKVSDDPFKKVTKMIKDMVIKLMEEANDEAEHKGWCDTELSTNKQTRDAKSTSVDQLTASIEQMTAAGQKLASEVSELSAQVAELDGAVSKATEIRQSEKEKNTATVADAKAAITAVESATTVLREFYDKAASATAMIQTKVVQMPETYSKPYTGMGGEGGILGMLEVILSDFQRLETETSETEMTNQKQYDQFMSDSSEDKAVKNQQIKHKSNHRTKLDSDAAQAKNDLKSTQEELSAAMDYYEKLKPSCVDAGVSYEERVARRKEEIESLQEALKILSGEDI